MLSYLKVKNFALIESLEVDFSEGFNVLTGETGAGKSILIKALALLQGQRSSTEFIRDQEDSAEVTATFSSVSKKVKEILKELEIESEEDQLVIKRVISRKGNHKISVNGSVITLQDLKSIAQEILEICGQHDNQKLVEQEYQLNTLDEYGSLSSLTKEIQKEVEAINKLKKEKESLSMDPQMRIQRIDFLKFQIDEIKKNWISNEQDKAMEDQLRKALGSKDLLQTCEEVENSLFGEDFSVVTALEKLKRFIQASSKHEPGFEEQGVKVEEAVTSLEEVGEYFNRYKKSLNADEKTINQIVEKSEQVKRLKRKYGQDLNVVKEKQDSLTSELKNLQNLEEAQKELDKKIKALESSALKKAEELREKRMAVAKDLSKKITNQLQDLNMASALFSVSFQAKSLSYDGIDDVCYMIAPNKGEGLKPLDKIASGGELSRIMLAITRVITEKSNISLYVFDEVDAGIGGDTGKIVGLKLRQVASKHQVLCITHLPQVAVYGQHNFLISKKEQNKRTISEIHPLNEGDKVKEIARMLGGGLAQKQSLENAEAMIKEAKKL